MRQTDGKQVPWEHSALTGQFFFKPAVETSQAAQSPAAAAPPLALSEETKARAEELSALKKRLAELEANMTNQKREYTSRVDEMTRLKEKMAQRERELRQREAERERKRQSALLKPAVPRIENKRDLQDTVRSVASFRAWSVAVSGEGSDKVCMAYATPRASNRNRAERAQAWAYVTSFPASKIRYEVSIKFGPALKEGPPTELTIGADVFRLFTKGNHVFVDRDEAVVAAMKKGRRMVVTARSGQGTLMEDTYSLSGLTAALQKVALACP